MKAPFNIQQPDWDLWLKETEENLKNLGFNRYSQNLKNEDFAYWKTFYRGTKKVYQIGLLFYDYRKFTVFSHISNIHEVAANHISISYECYLLNKNGRYDLSVSDDITLEEFEKISAEFYKSMKKCIK